MSGKAVYASATYHPIAKALFENKETRTVMIRQILDGADTVRVAGHVFVKGRRPRA